MTSILAPALAFTLAPTAVGCLSCAARCATAAHAERDMAVAASAAGRAAAPLSVDFAGGRL